MFRTFQGRNGEALLEFIAFETRTPNSRPEIRIIISCPAPYRANLGKGEKVRTEGKYIENRVLTLCVPEVFENLRSELMNSGA